MMERCLKYLLILAAAAVLAGAPAMADEVRSEDPAPPVARPAEPKEAARQGSPSITVYYLYTKPRCRTCNNIETYAAEVVTGSFAEQIAAGKVRWLALDTDKPENAHFVEDFELYTKAVVVAESTDGKVVRWKNLQRIWELVRDKAAFQEYIAGEVGAFLEGTGG